MSTSSHVTSIPATFPSAPMRNSAGAYSVAGPLRSPNANCWNIIQYSPLTCSNLLSVCHVASLRLATNVFLSAARSSVKFR